MFGDEGFGVEAVKQLQKSDPFPKGVDIIDGGTQGIYLLDYVESTDCLLVFDALIPREYECKVYVYRNEELPAFIHRKLSSHQIGLSELLSLAKLHDRFPNEIALIGIPPQDLKMGIGLSPAARELLPQAVAEGRKIIMNWLSMT
ncbi:MAG: hydrogenase maturation protease [FCB group bacterium]|nr:hydrogenase maturation protease [FCB group bacterium]